MKKVAGGGRGGMPPSPHLNAAMQGTSLAKHQIFYLHMLSRLLYCYLKLPSTILLVWWGKWPKWKNNMADYHNYLHEQSLWNNMADYHNYLHEQSLWNNMADYHNYLHEQSLWNNMADYHNYLHEQSLWNNMADYHNYLHEQSLWNNMADYHNYLHEQSLWNNMADYHNYLHEQSLSALYCCFWKNIVRGKLHRCLSLLEIVLNPISLEKGGTLRWISLLKFVVGVAWCNATHFFVLTSCS